MAQKLCIRCYRNKRIHDARFPNAKLCAECFLSALNQLMDDIALSKRTKAILNGAEPITQRQAVEILRRRRLK